jgi:hypothetical protein
VNRLREPSADHDGHAGPVRRESDALAPIDPERHALEMRIEHAKRRIVEDLNRASALVGDVAAHAVRRLGTIAVVAGVVLASVVAYAFVRRSRRRARIDWR